MIEGYCGSSDADSVLTKQELGVVRQFKQLMRNRSGDGTDESDRTREQNRLDGQARRSFIWQLFSRQTRERAVLNHTNCMCDTRHDVSNERGSRATSPVGMNRLQPPSNKSVPISRYLGYLYVRIFPCWLHMQCYPRGQPSQMIGGIAGRSPGALTSTPFNNEIAQLAAYLPARLG